MKLNYIADGQGSIRQLTNGAGLVTDTYDYTAFGEELAHTGTTVNAFRYVGESFDANSGFYNLRARLYNPANGRFTSVDPLDGDPSSSVSLHRYLYGNNSPSNFNDPSGKGPVTIAEALAPALIVMTLATVAIATYNYLYGYGKSAAWPSDHNAQWNGGRVACPSCKIKKYPCGTALRAVFFPNKTGILQTKFLQKYHGLKADGWPVHRVK